ncbi:MAG: beta-lactamase family protein, partial [Leptospirales bacterium]|nr:beta-lactamase family protein [Leptospirales bacterium]
MKKFLKKAGLVFVLILCGLMVFTAFPSNQYLWKVVRHGTPDIDDYLIFANRTVKAANPQSWRISANYNQASIPVSRLPYFEQFETVAYLVVQDSAIVFEQYWDDYSTESLSGSFSVAKSIVSLLAGIARDEGKIVSFDQSVADFYPPYATDNRKEITIKDVLTMSAGLDWDEAYSSLFSITTKAYYGENIESLIANLKLAGKPGVRHRYQSGVTELLSLIVANAVGTTLSEYASEKL